MAIRRQRRSVSDGQGTHNYRTGNIRSGKPSHCPERDVRGPGSGTWARWTADGATDGRPRTVSSWLDPPWGRRADGPESHRHAHRRADGILGFASQPQSRPLSPYPCPAAVPAHARGELRPRYTVQAHSSSYATSLSHNTEERSKMGQLGWSGGRGPGTCEVQ